MQPPDQASQQVHHIHHPAVPPLQNRNTSGLAIASLVLGILSFLGAGILFVPPLLAAIFGHKAIGACKRDPLLDGKGLAITGVVLGWLCLAGWILFFLFFGGLAILGIAGGAASGIQHGMP